MDAQQSARVCIDILRDRARSAVGTCRIVDPTLPMVPVTYEWEFTRLLRNKIAWWQKQRRRAEKAPAYEQQADQVQFAADMVALLKAVR